MRYVAWLRIASRKMKISGKGCMKYLPCMVQVQLSERLRIRASGPPSFLARRNLESAIWGAQEERSFEVFGTGSSASVGPSLALRSRIRASCPQQPSSPSPAGPRRAPWTGLFVASRLGRFNPLPVQP